MCVCVGGVTAAKSVFPYKCRVSWKALLARPPPTPAARQREGCRGLGALGLPAGEGTAAGAAPETPAKPEWRAEAAGSTAAGARDCCFSPALGRTGQCGAVADRASASFS